jgi:hypothetical protein
MLLSAAARRLTTSCRHDRHSNQRLSAQPYTRTFSIGELHARALFSQARSVTLPEFKFELCNAGAVDPGILG